jgi:hypothetical protein
LNPTNEEDFPRYCPLARGAAFQNRADLQIQPRDQKNMNPYTDPFTAKLFIFGFCISACAVSFFMGRLSSEMFADEETPENQNDNQEKIEEC